MTTPATSAVRKIDPGGSLAGLISETFEEIGVLVGEVNIANGWDTSRQMIADPTGYNDRWVAAHKIAELGLIATEVAEAIEEVRGGHEMTETYYSYKPVPPSLAVEFNNGAEARAHWESTQVPKPEGVPSELADVLIRAFDIADAYGIDLGAALVEKLNHNATRGLHHGGKAI
jgi:NTP pyrophosphatase (non-canonical NTP hydrolase)